MRRGSSRGRSARVVDDRLKSPAIIKEIERNAPNAETTSMLNNKHLKDWSCIVSQRMAHLSIPQAIGLATWSFGTVMARSSSLTQVSHLIAQINGEKTNTVRQRLKEWYQEAPAKKGLHRREKEKEMNTLIKLNKKNPSVVCTSDRLSSIAIIDPTIPDSQHIAIGIKPDTATYILENKTDAIEQITTILAQHQGIAALHIITHGAPGHIQLGNTQLNSQTLPHYSQQIQQWRNSLTADAEIIIYGCNVAGADTKEVTDGAGNDIFVLQDTATELSQVDLITDLTADDKIQLIDVTFSQLTFE